jgi:hypothetical protein
VQFAYSASLLTRSPQLTVTSAPPFRRPSIWTSLTRPVSKPAVPPSRIRRPPAGSFPPSPQRHRTAVFLRLHPVRRNRLRPARPTAGATTSGRCARGLPSRSSSGPTASWRCPHVGCPRVTTRCKGTTAIAPRGRNRAGGVAAGLVSVLIAPASCRPPRRRPHRTCSNIHAARPAIDRVSVHCGRFLDSERR